MKNQLFLSGLLIIGLIFGLGMARSQAKELALSPELVSCLKGALGEAVFAEIASGARAPTAAEKQAAQGCSRLLPTITDSQPTPTDSQEPSETSPRLDQEEIQVCLESVLGTDRFAALRAGQAGEPTASEKAQAEACFTKYGKPTLARRSTSSQPTATTTSDKSTGMPASMVNCLKEALGEAVFTAIASGQRPPTTTEQQAGEACFAQHRAEVTASLPESDNGHEHSDGSPLGLDPEKEACVARIMGDDFAKAKVGVQPSEEKMKQVATECFGYAEDKWKEEEAHRRTARSEVPGVTDDCMDQVFGKEVADQIRQGGDIDKSQFEAYRDKMEACFKSKYAQRSGDGEQSIEPTFSPNTEEEAVLRAQREALRKNPAYPSGVPSATYSSSSPSTTSSAPSNDGERERCVKEALGANYKAYQQGQYYPSPDDYTKMKACYR